MKLSKYEPFGKEWEKEVSKHTKKELIRFLKSTLKSKAKLELMIEHGLGYEDMKNDITYP